MPCFSEQLPKLIKYPITFQNMQWEGRELMWNTGQTEAVNIIYHQGATQRGAVREAAGAAGTPGDERKMLDLYYSSVYTDA